MKDTEIEETEPYCNECGEDKELAYLDQYANGENWLCKTCGHNFMYQPKSEK